VTFMAAQVESFEISILKCRMTELCKITHCKRGSSDYSKPCFSFLQSPAEGLVFRHALRVCLDDCVLCGTERINEIADFALALVATHDINR